MKNLNNYSGVWKNTLSHSAVKKALAVQELVQEKVTALSVIKQQIELIQAEHDGLPNLKELLDNDDDGFIKWAVENVTAHDIAMHSAAIAKRRNEREK